MKIKHCFSECKVSYGVDENIFQGMELGEDFIQNMHYSLSQ